MLLIRNDSRPFGAAYSNRPREEFLSTRGNGPCDADDKQNQSGQPEQDRHSTNGPARERPMDRRAEQEYRGKHRPDTMTGDVNEAVQGKQDRSDESGEAIALIGTFLHRKHFPSEKHESGNDKDDGRPTEFGPSPKPIAFGMKRALFTERCCAKGCEHRLKIPETNSDPRRVTQKVEDVRENPPAKISGDINAADLAKMESFHRLAAKNQQRGTEKQQKGSDDRELGRRSLPKRKDSEPKRAACDQNAHSSAGKIQNDRGHDDRERKWPNYPAFPALANVILTAGEVTVESTALVFAEKEPLGYVSDHIGLRARLSLTPTG